MRSSVRAEVVREASAQRFDRAAPDITFAEYDRLVASWQRRSKRRPTFPGRERLKSQLAALHYILQSFETGKDYSEAQVNATIQDRNPFDIDHVQLRRMMVDNAMLDRTADGSRYRRHQGYLAMFNWDPAIPGTRPFDPAAT